MKHRSRPPEQDDLLRGRLVDMIDPRHELVKMAALIDWEALDAQARFAVPTPEHYLPLLYCIAVQREDEPVSFPVEGIDMGSLSMLTVGIGAIRALQFPQP